MSKTAVIFPGVGYTKDRPLLYYSGKLAAARDYRLVHLDFSGINWSKDKLKDQEFLLQILEECLQRTERALGDIGLDSSDDIIFISKSIGTVVATAYAKRNSLKARQVCFSPLEYIDRFAEDENGILFYGNDDPFADYAEIEKIIAEKKLESYLIDGGNHSLETGDVIKDIDNLKGMLKVVEGLLK